MVKSLLSDEEAREVESAIQRVEQQSASELVVAVVDSSGNYLASRLVLAAAWALAATVALHFALPELSPLALVVLQSAIGALTFVVSGWAPIYRLFIRPEEAERAVAQRAFALFSERGVHRTRDRSGLLILISTLEHRVVMLGDSGIHERIGEEGWANQVSFLVTRIREGKAKQGLLEVIAHFEPILARVAPRRDDDVNELPDSVVRG